MALVFAIGALLVIFAGAGLFLSWLARFTGNEDSPVDPDDTVW